MKLYKILFYSLLLLVVSSCSKGKNNGIPSYLQIENVSLTTTAAQGSNHHFISDLWIETEGEEIGVFEYPNVIPALVSGERELIINAGVYTRGDFNTREIYPAYKPYIVDVTFKEKDTITVNPSFEYYDEVDFAVIDDFESGSIFSSVSRTDIADTNNVEGKAMHIHLDASNETFSTKTSSAISIPLQRKVYLEMEFKGNNDFGIGIEGIANGQVTNSYFFEQFVPSNANGWFKIYYDITNIVNSLDADSFNFFFESFKYTDNEESDIYIDNFKIVVI